MRSLRELQDAFARRVVRGRGSALPELAGARGMSGDAALAIYRNAMMATYRKALRETYPVVLALIGAPCFDQAAREYARLTPSRSGDLYEYGAEFAAFLAKHAPTRRLAYLPDVARLERAIEAAQRAAEAAPLTVARLAAVAPEALARVRLVLHPALALLASPYPVLAIWQANQPGVADDARTVHLADGADRLLLMRRGWDVAVLRLGAAEFALLDALARDEPLGRAWEGAAAADAAFDLGTVLWWHFAAGTFVDLHGG